MQKCYPIFTKRGNSIKRESIILKSKFDTYFSKLSLRLKDGGLKTMNVEYIAKCF